MDHIRLLRQFRSYRQDSAGQALHSASRFGFPPSPLQSYLGSSELHHCPEIGLESGSDCGSVASCSLMLSVGGFPLSTAKIIALLLIQVTSVGLPVHFQPFQILFILCSSGPCSRKFPATARRVSHGECSTSNGQAGGRNPRHGVLGHPRQPLCTSLRQPRSKIRTSSPPALPSRQIQGVPGHFTFICHPIATPPLHCTAPPRRWVP